MKKILTIVGTRPEAIKMAILIKKLSLSPHIDHKLCVTAQHREMLDQVLQFFEISPDFDLDLMSSGQDLFDITSRSLLGLREVYNEFRPDWVLVHGDTTTCLTGSLSAFYSGIPIAHIEAGLRTGNLFSPFPEEANRVLVGRLANLHFAPTQRNVDNLIAEGIEADKICLTGNTVIDSLQYTRQKVRGFSAAVSDDRLREVFNGEDKILLITGHRRENFGKGFVNICDAIFDLANLYPSMYLVYPVHLNPNVQDPVRKRLGHLSNVILTEPLQYPDFVFAMNSSWAILTDSGGVQEEAPGLGKPVLVMRDTTERPEAVEAGTVILVGSNKRAIVDGVRSLHDNSELYEKMSVSHNPYGDGKAVERIMDRLIK